LKVDLHLHSRHSRRSAEWLFRRAGLAASYSEPAALLETLRTRGMQAFTLTDYECIDGCLELAERPGVFISEQIGALFPEDHCKVQVLVWDITEAQHRDMAGLRENIYDLQAYLAQHEIAHAVAHPLYRPEERFTLAHLEKLILLFRHFEGINGLRDRLSNETTQFVLASLTPEKLEELAHRHGRTPSHPEPWKKVLTGGSDDHGGMHAALAWTEVEDAHHHADFLAAVRAGRCQPRGQSGSPLIFSHGLYNNLRHFISSRFADAESSTLIGKAFSRFMEGEDPTEFSWAEKLGFVAQGIATGKIFELAKPANASLWRQFAGAFSRSDIKKVLAEEPNDHAEPERRAFAVANHLANQLAFRVFTSFIKQITSGNIIEAIREASLLVPILGTLLPYLYGFQSQTPNRRWLREACRSLAGEGHLPLALRNERGTRSHGDQFPLHGADSRYPDQKLSPNWRV
jgi:hypothetical protein